MKIRRASVDDAEGIAHVHVGTWQSAYRGIVPDDYLDGLNVAARVEGYRRFRTLEDPARPMWVCEINESIVGFVGVGPSIDEDGIGELYAIYVSEEQWGSGAGDELMKQATEWLRSRYRQATLWVLSENERARRFYERLGWFFDGTTKDDDRGSFVLHEVRYRVEL